jgi:hypothetical protein
VSSFKEIKPVDWKRPRHIDVVFESSQGIIESTVEHDTIEAARDWRNEFHRMSFRPLVPLIDRWMELSIIGVMFLYRRNRHALLNPTEDTTMGYALISP